jgi:predicted DNA-binding transcriptional regulator AlpA
MDGERFLDQDEVATVLGVSPGTVSNWRVQGRGPRFVRVTARCIRYRESDVRDWLESNEVEPTREVEK